MARFIKAEEAIDVSRPPVLAYGIPGVGKTSLAQTAKNPITLDFDGGVHRSAFRKATLRFERWEEVVDVQHKGFVEDGHVVFGPNFLGYETIVIDTIGSCLTLMGASIVAGNAKMGTRQGGLSLQGYGALKMLFDQWLTGLRQAGKQVIMIAHQKEEKEGDDRVMRPDIIGASYGIVMNSADIVGYMTYRNNVRTISWDPTDLYFAKNGASLKGGPIPDFNGTPDFMNTLLTQAKANLGKVSEASGLVAKTVSAWHERLHHEDVNLAKLNESLVDFIPIGPGPIKTQVWSIYTDLMKKHNLRYDKETKAFVQVEGGA